MRRLTMFVILILLLAGCATLDLDKDEVVKEEETKTKEEQQPSIATDHQLSKDNYRTILPYRPSEARGVITQQVSNRVDIDEMEESLRRHSKEYFDPKKYYFEEGQYLTRDLVLDWIDDLNPEEKEFDEDTSEKEKKKFFKENPRFLSHILEQNFLEKKDDDTVELAGVSLGIALKSVYRYQTEEGGPDYYEDISKSEMLKKGKKAAQEILERIRQIEGVENVPILIELYREEEQSSPVPGSFVARTYVQGGDMKIDKWESIDEKHVLFPSEEAEEQYFEDYQLINNFGEEVAQFFPDYVGYVGDGFYVDGELNRLSIDILLEFYSKGEVIGFTQYTYGLVQEMLPNHYDLEIKISSADTLESLIYREAGEDEAKVHILHQ